MILLAVRLSSHLQFGIGDGKGIACEISATRQGNPLGDHERAFKRIKSWRWSKIQAFGGRNDDDDPAAAAASSGDGGV